MKIIERNCRIYYENTQKFNTFYLGVCFHQPLKAVTAAKSRLLALVLSESCEKYDTKIELNKALSKLGGAELNIQTVKKGAELILQFIISAPAGSEEACFELLNEIIFHPLLRNNEFAVSKKEYLKNLIADKITDPKAYALDRCIELMFDGKGFGTDADGKKEDIDKINCLYEHYLHILSSSKTEIFVIGNIAEDKMLSHAEKYFGTLKSGLMDTGSFKAAEAKRVEEKANTEQTKLCIGLDMGQGSRFEKMVYNEMLGGENSLLFNEIREKSSLCYYIGSTYYSLADTAVIQAGIEYSAAEKVIEITKSLIYINNTKGSVEQAKRTIADRLRGIGDHPLALADFYITQGITGDDISPENMINEINKIEKINIRPEIKMIYILGGKNDDSKNA